MSLRDEHLKKALQHAPDSDVKPSDAARKVVLDYADNAVKLHRESWFTRVISAFNNWQLSRWQLTGMSSLAASLLVVVMIWHENPDDPMQVVTAPTEISEVAPRSESEPKLAQAESARDDLNKAERSSQATVEAAPVANESFAASAEIATHKAKEDVLAKTRPTNREADTAPEPAAIEPPAYKTVIASVPASAQEAASDVAGTDASADGAGKPATARTAEIGMPRKKMEDAEQAQSEAKANLPSAIAAKPAVSTSNTALLQALRKQGGQSLANEDIQAGNFRILYLSKPTPAGAPLLDEATGYPMEIIADDSANLVDEVAVYNRAMRDWHLNQSK